METLGYLLAEALVSDEAEAITKAIFDKIKNKDLDSLVSSNYLKKIKMTPELMKKEQENEKRRTTTHFFQREITGPFNDYLRDEYKKKGFHFEEGVRVFLNIYPNLPEIDKYGNAMPLRSKNGKTKAINIKLFLTGNKINNSYRKYLFHEIVHALDFIRTGLKRNIGQEKKLLKNAGGDKEYAYILNELEKNAAINILASFKKKYPKRWENIYTFSDLISKMGKSVFFAYSNHKEKLLKDPKFYKPMLKRLYRENLIPQKMSMALGSNLTLDQIENFKSWDELIKKAKKII